MKRLFKIYGNIIKINFSILLAHRSNFYNSIIITVGWGLVSVLTIFLLTSRVSHIYGWSREELYMLTGLFAVIVGIFHTFFSASMERFGRTISLGELDSYLLMPLDTQLYLSTKAFRPVSSLRILIGVLFIIFISPHLHATYTVFTIVIFLFFILIGVLLLYSFWFLVITCMIWNPNLTNLIDFLFVFNNLSRYPPAMLIYTKNIFLYILIPLTLISSVPARFILGKVTLLEVVGLLTCSLSLFIASRLFWKFALKHYTSASS